MTKDSRASVLVPCPTVPDDFAGWLTQTRGLVARNKAKVDFHLKFSSPGGGRVLRMLCGIGHAFGTWMRAIRMPGLHVVYFPIFYLPNVLAAVLLWLSRTPYICRISGKELMPGNPLAFRLRVAFLRRATAIICLNEDSVTQLAALGVPCGRLHNLGNPVDCDRFHPPTSAERTAARVALGITVEKRLVIGTVGTVCARKGTRELIEAVGRLRFEGLALRVCGPRSGTTETDPSFVADCDVRATAAEADVVLLGRSDEIPSFLAALDVFVLPSYSEGMPNSLLEAMATGLPVVASDIPGVSDIIQSPKTGILVPPGDVSALAASLQGLLDNEELRTRLGVAARTRIEDAFATEVVDAGYRALLSDHAQRATGENLAASRTDCDHPL